MTLSDHDAPSARPSDLALASARDHAAFTRLVETHSAAMARVTIVICAGDREMARDAVQQAWQVAWRRLGSVRDESKLRSWLFSVAANEARQLVRRRRPHLSTDELMLEGRHPNVDEVLDLEAALAALEPDHRVILSLRYVAGFTSEEIAEATGRSASGVRVLLSRLLSRLRKELSNA